LGLKAYIIARYMKNHGKSNSANTPWLVIYCLSFVKSLIGAGPALAGFNLACSNINSKSFGDRLRSILLLILTRILDLITSILPM